MFMTSAGFSPSSNAFRALAAEEIDTVGSFLRLEAKLFSKENLDRNGSLNLKTAEVMRLQGLWMWAYCKRATHGNPEEINWSITASEP